MIVSAHQSAYLPWAGYIQRIAMSDVFVLLDKVQFEKNSFSNRNRIKGANGEMWLSVPVQLKGHTSSTMNMLQIAGTSNWNNKHWRSIKQSYGKAPYFAVHVPFFESLYEQKWTYLCELNQRILNYILDFLEIRTPIYFQSDLDVEGKKQELIVDICHYFEARAFIFGTEGRNYADSDFFEEHGLEIFVHEYIETPYAQLWGSHVAKLSVIDMLFNCSVSEIQAGLGLT